MKMDFQKIRERLGLSSDKPLTPEEPGRAVPYWGISGEDCGANRLYGNPFP